jgi:hypothetical protein
MAGLHMVIDPVCAIKKPKEKWATPESDTRESATAIHEKTIVKVLERAANNSAFIAQLTSQGSKILQGHNLTMEEKAALVSGDINWIETHVGKLDDQLSTWLWCRLQQEIW